MSDEPSAAFIEAEENQARRLQRIEQLMGMEPLPMDRLRALVCGVLDGIRYDALMELVNAAVEANHHPTPPNQSPHIGNRLFVPVCVRCRTEWPCRMHKALTDLKETG